MYKNAIEIDPEFATAHRTIYEEGVSMIIFKRRVLFFLTIAALVVNVISMMAAEEFPAKLEPVLIVSKGSKLFGHMYVAEGKGPHPCTIFLHGFPGYEKNLDLAQAVRQEGWNALFFHYRGAWGSEGMFSISNAMEDVSAVLEYLNLDTTKDKYRVNPDRIVLIGHCLGGFLSLMTAAKNPSVTYVIAIAPFNFGKTVKFLASNPLALKIAEKVLDSSQLPVNSNDDFTVTHLIEKADEYNLDNYAPILAKKTLLLIGGKRDTTPGAIYFMPLVKAIQKQNALRLTHVLLEADHNFSYTRMGLINAVISWLSEQCDRKESISVRIPE